MSAFVWLDYSETGREVRHPLSVRFFSLASADERARQSLQVADQGQWLFIAFPLLTTGVFRTLTPLCSKIKMREMALCETHRVRMLKTQSPEIATWTDNSLLRTTTLMSPHACELACYLLSPSRICVRETDWLTP